MLHPLFLLAQTTHPTTTQAVAAAGSAGSVIVDAYRTTQIGLFAAMVTIGGACLAAMNFIWKLKEEVYAKEAYLTQVAHLRDVEPNTSPLLGFDQLRRLSLLTAIAAFIVAALQLTLGYVRETWSSVICFASVAIIFASLIKLIHLIVVTSHYATRLSEQEANQKIEALRARPAGHSH